jgi:superoxide dismutase, Cu-Zn family
MRPAVAALALSFLAVRLLAQPPAPAPATPPPPPTKLAKDGALVVTLMDSTGQKAGTASFKKDKKGDLLDVEISLINMPPGEHAVHIHQNPVCDAPDFKGAGGHFNPDGKQHGIKNPMGHHNGDLPQNIMISSSNSGEMSFKVNYLSLAPDAANSILGHSIVVHEKADDMKTDPTGNAGNRIGCGVISAPKP